MSGGDYLTYYPQCSTVDFKEYSAEAAADYDPLNMEYMLDNVQEASVPGLTVGSVCLLAAFLLVLWSCILCCVPHEWIKEPAYSKVYEGSSAWGISGSVGKVGKIVPDSFDTVELLKTELDNFLGEAQEVVDTGKDLMVVLEKLEDDLEKQPLAPAGLTEAIAGAKEALDTTDSGVKENLEDIMGTFDSILEHKKDSGQISKSLVAVFVVLFSLMILIASVIGCCSIAGKTPGMTYCWLVFMWLMLVIGFVLVANFRLANVSLDKTCLYIDDYAIRMIGEQVEAGDAGRMQELARYYFQPIDSPKKNSEELGQLWNIPLDEIFDSIDTVQKDLYTDEGTLTQTALATSPDTQQALIEGKDLFPKLKNNVETSIDTLTGDLFNRIHADLKDLLCCTYHGAINSVYSGWLAASICGLLLAILVTIQVLFVSAKFGNKQEPIARGYVPAPTQVVV